MSDYVDAARVGSFEIDVVKDTHFADNLCAVEMHIPAGISLGKHVHSYTHLSILAKGKALVEKFESGAEEPSEVLQLDASETPQVLLVRDNVYHRVTASEDAVWFCIHSELSVGE